MVFFILVFLNYQNSEGLYLANKNNNNPKGTGIAAESVNLLVEQ
jgi:hypothetical protein